MFHITGAEGPAAIADRRVYACGEGPVEPTSNKRFDYDQTVADGRVASNQTPLRLALLDDDSAFLVVLTKRLDERSWHHQAFTVAIPTERVAEMHFDAVVVDIELLGADAWHWLRALGDVSPAPAIVVCTAGSTVDDRVRALQLGVDDWLTKPCHPEEVLARVEAVVRRLRRLQAPQLGSFVVGELEIDRRLYQAFVHGDSLELKRREYQVLAVLAGAVGNVLRREFIYERVWGRPMVRDDRSVDVVIHKLRRKLLQASPGWEYIHTHPTAGYRFAPGARGSSDSGKAAYPRSRSLG